MRRSILYFAVLALLASSSSAWALGVGGGMRGGGVRAGDRNNGNNPNRNREETEKKDAWEKAPPPAAVEIAELDTTRFDAVALELQINEEQKSKLDKAKLEIATERQKLLDAQEAARAAYENAQTQAEANAAAPKVGSTAAACRSCNPKSKWESALANHLKRDQLIKYKASPERTAAAAEAK